MSATTAVPTLIDVNVTETYREVETWLDSIDGGNVDGGELATRQLAVVEPDLELLGDSPACRTTCARTYGFLQELRGRVRRIAGIVSDDLRNEEDRARLDAESAS